MFFSGERGDDGRKVEVLVRNVKSDDAGGGEVSAVEAEGLDSEEVDRDCIA